MKPDCVLNPTTSALTHIKENFMTYTETSLAIPKAHNLTMLNQFQGNMGYCANHYGVKKQCM